MGYTEERTEQAGFVEIIPKAPRPSSGFSLDSSSSSGSSSGLFSGTSSSSSSSGSSSLSSGLSSSFGSSSLSSGSSSSFDDSSLIESILTQIRPLISQTVSSAVAGQSSSSGQDSLLILRPGSSSTSSSTSSSSSDLVSQILAQISPLVSQTVSSVVGANSQTSNRARTAGIQTPRARSGLAPTLDTSASVPDRETLFGSGDNFQVQINHAGANIEY